MSRSAMTMQQRWTAQQRANLMQNKRDEGSEWYSWRGGAIKGHYDAHLMVFKVEEYEGARCTSFAYDRGVDAVLHIDKLLVVHAWEIIGCDPDNKETTNGN